MIDVNFDGLIGPSHHFGGLGVGNIASQDSKHGISNPKAAALEGLVKMRIVQMITGQQIILPPPTRPNWAMIRLVAGKTTKRDALRRCYNEYPNLLSAAYSSAFMWAANAATVAPICDTQDNTLQIVVANLVSSLHRGQEGRQRYGQLRHILERVPDCVVHRPLPSVTALRDEGAANHVRLDNTGNSNRIQESQAIHLFVYGPEESTSTQRFPGRQSKLASQIVASRLNLPPETVFFAQQSQEAIDAGVFHNDVIAMSHRNWLAYLEQAWDDDALILDQMQTRFQQLNGTPLHAVRIERTKLSLEEAVRTYFFNSQIITRGDGGFVLLCPIQCSDSTAIKNLIRDWIADPSSPVAEVYYLSLGQSMANGGGPACLRLRVPMSESQAKHLPETFRMSEERDDQLLRQIKNRYPESVSLDDLARLDFAQHVESVSKSMFE